MNKTIIFLSFAIFLSACARLSQRAANQTTAPTPSPTPQAKIVLLPPAGVDLTKTAISGAAGKKINPVVITISVSNNSDAPLTNPKISTPKGTIFFYDTKDVRYDKADSDASRNYVFNLDSINPGETKSGDLSAYSFVQGTTNLKFSLTAQDGRSWDSNSLDFNFVTR